MRTLKKILALVLALVMSLSLMATAGAASFQDVTDDNPYKTAIDVLTELKVVKGYGDGNFQPNGQLTRAEAAVLVYRIATGDVEDKYLDNYTYMQQSKFTDLEGYNWAKGYINYCQNAGIVVGTDATHFNPGGKVTGYQLLVMLLRTLGYGKAGEFADPKGWELQTAAIAEREKITKNVTTGDFGAPAPRAMVAEILFRGLLSETVTYSALVSGGYTKGETLGKREFGLEEVIGVVMANEYADLEGSKTLDADETRFVDLEGSKAYTVTNQKTTLDDIGESRLVYIQNNTKLLWMGDSGLNGIGDTEMYAKDLKELKATANATGDGDHFINFDRVGNRISDYKIKYVLRGDKDGLIGGLIPADVVLRINNASGDKRAAINAATGDVETTITPKKNISNVDLSYIKAIFGEADKTVNVVGSYVDGEVYVGSQSIVDVSDVTNDNFKYSYDKFEAEFIYTTDGTVVTGNENGNYVKVIDNDGDGTVDYVLKTVYTFAQVSRVKDDAYTLDTTNHILTVGTAACGISSDVMNNLTNQRVVTEDTLAKGDIVYYALIDGNAQTYKADSVTATIEKVDHNTWETTTADGTVYPKSGVHEHVEDEAYMSHPRDLAGKVSYELFFDRAGNLGVFVKSDAAGEFKLITDGWYHRLKDGKEYAVKAYTEEDGKGKQETIDITTNASLFVNDWTDSGNDWNRLKYFGGADHVLNAIGGTKVVTTVAAITADGTILPVENSSVTGRYQRSMLDINASDKVPTQKAVKGTVYSTTNGAATAYDVLGDQDDIRQADSTKLPTDPAAWTYDVRALDTTDYYVVYPNAAGTGVEVIHTVGYAKAPDVETYNKKGYVEDIYAVGTYHEAENNVGVQNYYIADVVVVELNHAPDGTGELVFVVDDTARFTDVRYRDVKIINSKGEVENVKVDWTGNVTNTLSYVDGKDNNKQVRPGFYYLFGDKTDVCYLSNNKSSAGTVANRVPLDADQIRETGVVTVGRVEKSVWTQDNKYVVVQEWNKTADGTAVPATAGAPYTMSETTPLYTLEYKYTGYQGSTPALEKTTNDVVLAPRVDETQDSTLWRDAELRRVEQNATYYNYNDILVVHSKGAATYAVSFDNIYRDLVKPERSEPYGFVRDYAQDVWNNIIPSAPDTNLTTTFGTFYGYAFGLNKAGNPAVATLPNTKLEDLKAAEIKETGTLALTYAQAKDANNSLYFTKSDISLKYDTKVDLDVPVSVDGVPAFDLTVTYKDANGVSKDAKYTLSVDEAEKYKTLVPVDGILTVNDDNTVSDNGTRRTIQQYINAVEKGQPARRQTFAWAFFNDAGEIKDYGENMQSGEVSYWTVTVTSEAGVPNTYVSGAPDGKIVVVNTDDSDLALPDDTKIDVMKVGDEYEVTVKAEPGVTPVIVLTSGTYAMKDLGVKTLSLSAQAHTWTRTLTAAEVGTDTVIYIRAIVGGDDPIKLPEADTPATEAERKDATDKVTAAGTALKAIDATKVPEDKKDAYDAAVKAAEDAIKAAQALIADQTATKAAIDAAVAKAEKAVKDAEAIAEGKEAYAVTVAEASKTVAKVDKAQATEGETVTITVTPETGKTVKSIEVKAGAETVTPVEANKTYTFKMPAKAVEVSVTITYEDDKEPITEAKDTVRAIADGATWKFYSYGGTSINDADAKAALVRDYAAANGFAASKFTGEVLFGKTTASMTTTDGDVISVTIVQNPASGTTGDGSRVDPCPLYALKYNGTTFMYATSTENTTGKIKGLAEGVYMPDSVKLGSNGLTVNSTGKATVVGSLTYVTLAGTDKYDITFVDAVKLATSHDTDTINKVYVNTGTGALGWEEQGVNTLVQKTCDLRVEEKTAAKANLQLKLVDSGPVLGTDKFDKYDITEAKKASGNSVKTTFDFKASELKNSAAGVTFKVVPVYTVNLGGEKLTPNASGEVTINGAKNGDHYLVVDYTATDGKHYEVKGGSYTNVKDTNASGVLDLSSFCAANYNNVSKYINANGEIDIMKVVKVTIPANVLAGTKLKGYGTAGETVTIASYGTAAEAMVPEKAEVEFTGAANNVDFVVVKDADNTIATIAKPATGDFKGTATLRGKDVTIAKADKTQAITITITKGTNEYFNDSVFASTTGPFTISNKTVSEWYSVTDAGTDNEAVSQIGSAAKVAAGTYRVTLKNLACADGKVPVEVTEGKNDLTLTISGASFTAVDNTLEDSPKTATFEKNDDGTYNVTLTFKFKAAAA